MCRNLRRNVFFRQSGKGDEDNSKADEEDEGGKGDDDGGYGDDAKERDHGGSSDSKPGWRQHESIQHNNQPKAMMGTTRAVMTRAAKARARMAYVGLVGLLPRIAQLQWPKTLATMVVAKTQDGINLPHQHLLTKIHQPNKVTFCKQCDGFSRTLMWHKYHWCDKEKLRLENPSRQAQKHNLKLNTRSTVSKSIELKELYLIFSSTAPWTVHLWESISMDGIWETDGRSWILPTKLKDAYVVIVQINHPITKKQEMLSSDENISNVVTLLRHSKCCH
jgi:hypothetical protein